MLRKTDIPNQSPISALKEDFWKASEEALFSRRVIAAVIDKSVAWMERKALTGDGIPYFKCGRSSKLAYSRVLYELTRALAN